MSTSLQSVIKDLIVFPYDTETIESLSSACKTYSSEISLDNFEACLLFLCQGTCHDDLVSHIEEKTGKMFPDRVYRGLAGHIVSLVMNDEEVTVQKKVLFSLLVRNVMFFSFSSKNELIKKCISPQFYIPYDDFWQEQSSIGDISASKLFPDVFSCDTFEQLGCTVDEVYPAIRILAKQYARTNYYNSVSHIKQEENEDDFAYAVRVVNEIKSVDWEYVDLNPVETLKKVGLKSSTRMTLGQIYDVVETDNLDNMDFSRSSILLRSIYKGENTELSTFKMNPLHFAIALYYEWLFESLKDGYNE